jgi:hypothetical protein
LPNPVCEFWYFRDDVMQLFEAGCRVLHHKMVLLTFVETKVRPAAGTEIVLKYGISHY